MAAKKDEKKFVVGDRVKWSSQSQGSRKEKVGDVVAVLAPGDSASIFSDDLTKAHNAKPLVDPGLPRKIESYIVLVPHSGKGKGQLYWPVPSVLEKARSKKTA